MIQTSINTKTKNRVLKSLKFRGYWVNDLVKIKEFFEISNFHFIEYGIINKTNSTPYIKWVVYVSVVKLPMKRIIKIKGEYFNLVI